jgi:hypothetical protein
MMRPAEHIRATATDDGLAIVNMDSGEIFSANIVASRIWSGLMAGKTRDEIIAAIIGEFGASSTSLDTSVAAAPELFQNVVGRDYDAFVKSLVNKNLIEE